jgi:hypothetical protein
MVLPHVPHPNHPNPNRFKMMTLPVGGGWLAIELATQMAIELAV